METSRGQAAPESGTSSDEISTFDEPAADPEIAALLDFDPVPRKREVEGAWTPELQRQFIARLALSGSPGRAAEEMGKTETGVRKLYRSPEAASFRAAWQAAVELARKRAGEQAAMSYVRPGSAAPSLDRRRKLLSSTALAGPLPGQVLNERGEWEDEESIARRAEDAMDSIGLKLVRARRAFLAEISSCPGKRAAFEILTELPVDWDLAAKLEPQPFEPWRKPNAHQPDMVLTAESGWPFGEIGYGPDKKAQLLEALNQHRIENGQEPIDWGESTERSDAGANAPPE